MALHAAGFQVTTTDKVSLLSILQNNISNYLQASTISADEATNTIAVQALDWENEATFLPIRPSIIVCSDCLYNSATVVPLLNVLEKVRMIFCLLMRFLINCYFFSRQHITDFAVVLLVNEMRTALEEFLYLARRSITHQVTIQVFVLFFNVLAFLMICCDVFYNRKLESQNQV